MMRAGDRKQGITNAGLSERPYLSVILLSTFLVRHWRVQLANNYNADGKSHIKRMEICRTSFNWLLQLHLTLVSCDIS